MPGKGTPHVPSPSYATCPFCDHTARLDHCEAHILRKHPRPASLEGCTSIRCIKSIYYSVSTQEQYGHVREVFGDGFCYDCNHLVRRFRPRGKVYNHLSSTKVYETHVCKPKQQRVYQESETPVPRRPRRLPETLWTNIRKEFPKVEIEYKEDAVTIDDTATIRNILLSSGSGVKAFCDEIRQSGRDSKTFQYINDAMKETEDDYRKTDHDAKTAILDAIESIDKLYERRGAYVNSLLQKIKVLEERLAAAAP